MSRSEKISVLLSVIVAVVMGLFIMALSGGNSSDSSLPAIAASGTEEVASQPQYANDVDRLNRLSERLSRASDRWYSTVLGCGSQPAGGGLVSVDYALFDRLSDDGAAVLIAEAVFNAKRASLANSSNPASVDSQRQILQADESAGRCMARAGFKHAGFGEWLKARDLYSTQQDEPSKSMRSSAFMRGYLMEQRRSKIQASSR